MERLERVVEAGGRLLKVDQLGAKGVRLAARFLLTFDVGRVQQKTITISLGERVRQDLDARET